MKKHYFCFLFVLFATLGLSAQVYVKHNAAGTNNGSSWANAYTNLETALANTTAGEVWVAAGTYRTPSGTSFNLPNGVSLYGGFAGTETSLGQRNPATNLTTLSGDVLGDDVVGTFGTLRTDNAPHVVTVGAGAALIDGFSISGGNAAGMGAPINTSGGGIFSSGKVTIRHCNITDNFGTTGSAIYIATTADDAEISNSNISDNYGQAALYMRTVDGITVDSCVFSGNLNEIGTTNAAAFLAFNCQQLVLSNSSFTENKAPQAGALYCVTDSLPNVTNADNFVIQNCHFNDNQNTLAGANGNGVGGAARFRNASYSLLNCTFENNTSVSSGGHIRNDVEAADNIVITNCSFKKADAGGWGGAFTAYGGTFTITDCEYEENTCARLGGAVHNGFGGIISYSNCDFMNNVATSGTGSGGAIGLQNDQTTVNLTNCNFIGNFGGGSGGAIFTGTTASSNHLNLLNCVFEGNVTEGFGGAIQTGDNGPAQDGTLDAVNCIFNFNSGVEQGGAINISNVNTSITSCLFTNNIASSGTDPITGRGGAISLNVDSTTMDVVITNSTFAYNIGDYAAGISNWVDTTFAASSNTVIQNNIFISDGLPNYAIENGAPLVTSLGGNLFDDDTFDDYLNLPKDIKVDDADGLFVDPDNDNYRLQNDAVAVDAGVDAGAPLLDIEGNPRLNEVDMGAYENQFVSKDNEVLLDNNGLLAISPNPATGPMTIITLDTPWTGQVQLRLTNVLGQEVKYFEMEKTAGKMSFQLPLANLGNGIYHLAASNGSQVVVTPLIRN